MATKYKPRFFLNIVIPSVVAISLFTTAVMAFLIPSVEQNIMERKMEMIEELTHTVSSLLEEYDTEYRNGELTLAEAQKLAATKISHMRYGDENKDYFWIVNMEPQMISHPYRNELMDSDLKEYKDPNGVKIFVKAVDLVKQKNEGFIHYMWQWKDDSTRIVPKLSYVKGFEEWGWIVGTGIYLEDVQEEITGIKSRLVSISLVILALIAIILLFIVRGSSRIENRRHKAEEDLMLSNEKYKSLVDASTEGTIMLLDNRIIFSNQKMSTLISFPYEDIIQTKIDELFDINWEDCMQSFSDTIKSITLESKVICIPEQKEVVLSISKVKYDQSDGYIIVAKEVSRQRIIKKEMIHLSEELESNLHLINQSIKPFVRDLFSIGLNTSVIKVAELMKRKKSSVVFVQQQNSIIGVITEQDLSRRVLASSNDSLMAMDIMSSPVEKIHNTALLYEADIQFKHNNLSHLAVSKADGELIGYIHRHDILNFQQSNVSYILKEIEGTDSIEELKQIQQRSPVLVSALLQSGDKTQNIALLVSKITDAITQKVIQLAIEELGEAPCGFSFIVLGSEGRMEQTLSTDQDNAIIFDNKGTEEDRAYFLRLGSIISTNLNTIGYKFCDGNNMASNPKWCLTLDEWKKHFSFWVHNSESQAIMEAAIFFDFRSIYGQPEFVIELRDFVNQLAAAKEIFFYHMAQANLKFKMVSQSLSGTLDVKQALHPMVGFMRLYAFKENLNCTNTIERMEQLHDLKIIQDGAYVEWLQSYNFLMYLRLKHQSQQILENEKVDNLIDLDQLSEIDKAGLKRVLGEVKNVQTKIGLDFSIS